MKETLLVLYQILRDLVAMTGNVGIFSDPAAVQGTPGSLFGHVRQGQQQTDKIRVDDISDSAKPPADLDGSPGVAIIPGLRWIRNILMDSTAVSRVGDSTDAAADLDGTAHVSILAGLRWVRDQAVDVLSDTASLLLGQGDSTQAAADLDGTGGVSLFEGLRGIRNRLSALDAAKIQIITKTRNWGTNSGDHTLFTPSGDVGLFAVSVRASGALAAQYTSQAITGNGTTSPLLTDAQTTWAILSGANKQAMWTGDGGALDLPNGSIVNTNVKGTDNLGLVTFTYRAIWIAYTVGATLS